MKNALGFSKLRSKQTLAAIFLTALAAGAVGCGKDDKFVYYSKQEDLKVVMPNVKVKEVLGASGVDILWVVDNSASMSSAQQSVATNSAIFMQEFSKNSIDWKLGLISTDESDEPYLGFGTSVFNSRTTDPASAFSSAIAQLGLSGDAEEKSFNPILRQLKRYPDFIRPGVPLAVIMVTDAPEQSPIDAQNFLAQLRQLVGNDRPIYAYGVFGSTDMTGCTVPQDMEWQYKGSQYENFISSVTLGKVYSLCSPDYGKTLAEIGYAIAQNVARPSIYLSNRPEPSTIHVFFHGNELPGGAQEKGGYWYYDYGLNAVVFYSLEFAKAENEEVSLVYDKAGAWLPAEKGSK